jgi:hypothetical protein
MIEYLFDLIIIATLVIAFTALNGVIGNTIGEKLFGGKKKNVHSNASLQTQVGWKAVGGKQE